MRRVFCYFSFVFYLLNEVELFSKHITEEHLVLIKIIVCGLWMCVCASKCTCGCACMCVCLGWLKKGWCQDVAFVVLRGTDRISVGYQSWRAVTRMHGAWGGVVWWMTYRSVLLCLYCRTYQMLRAHPVTWLGFSLCLWGKKVWVVVYAQWRMIH